jgi:hypothetical protein
MRRDSLDGPWSRHAQGPWHNDALTPRFPLPLRVAFLAYGTHHANGHAKFKQGEIAKVLARLDEAGHPVPADRRTVYRAIQQAIEYGLLAEGSKALCLVVPSHRIAGGMGDEKAPCERHPRRRSTSLRAVS